MRIALMADIHANWQAFGACLAHARANGYDRLGFLGDYVGYGGDPSRVVDVLMDEVARGAFAIQGNHDLAISNQSQSHTLEADISLAWTRGQLGPEARAFLGGLPSRHQEGDQLFVHATPEATAKWPYLDDVGSALKALEACQAQAVFCGHVHVPALYALAGNGRGVAFAPVDGIPVPLSRHRRWLAVLGSVGQPRDRHSAAAYALLNLHRHELTFHRVPYDVEGAAAAIRAAGLPASLAERLAMGR
ncbi:MAG TPA: metallophosphoesterase family protein [Holophagaceae bacterium]|nr:metallophosphoesterase family protein [Holophagaceae bacterium]